MDAKQFDTLTRALRGTPSRRRTLRSLSVLGLAALFGSDVTTAKKKGGGKGGSKGKGKGKKKGNKKQPPAPGTCRGFDSDCTGQMAGGGNGLCCTNEGNVCLFCCSSNHRGCPGDRPKCCADGGTNACHQCCTDADCPNSPFHSCSKAPSGNVCV